MQGQSSSGSQRAGERPKTHGATSSTGTSQLVTGATSTPRSSQISTNSLDQPTPSPQVIQPINIPITTDNKSTEYSATGGRGAGFNVGRLQQRGNSTDLEQDLNQLRQQLEEVTKERDSLKQNNERVNAQWEGRVRRLQQQLREKGGGEATSEVSGRYHCIIALICVYVQYNNVCECVYRCV